ncbi:PadR family transcriptional regulator [Demequina sp. NBRC 110056]|uniref:PadR family transcriptional regulator n=1 Tax=Demequina sp. NBRC 110056 TaxID=1570345 RepID=UPI000A04DB76|nr:helix-turn-helix transcriptional regulator [Demequina sp. NBRC 110056]
MDIPKDLVAASAAPLVLSILADADSYGYAIIKRVGELSGGELEWTDGLLYPLLHRLERNGLVASRWGASESGRRRKYYSITPSGTAAIADHRAQWSAVASALDAAWNGARAELRAAAGPREALA